MIIRFLTFSFLVAAVNISPDMASGQTTPTATADRATTMASTYTTSNPIRPRDTADPSIVWADGKWYVYHTSSYRLEGRYPIVVSDDLSSWTQIGYILEPGHLPKWAANARSWWAPEVHKVNDKYIAYYTTREDSTNRFVIGAAVANSPAGPFRDVGAPIVRTETVGLIDVTYFQDPKSDKKYLIWKEDRNDFDPQEPTPLIMQEMTTNGLKLVGQPQEILRNDQPWEGVLVEAPSLVYREGWYYLFYSANVFTADEYSVGVARSKNVWGPYVKKPDPIMVHDADFSGPGHQCVIQDPDGVWHMFYHARLKRVERSHRYLMRDTIKFNADGWPVVNDGKPGPVSEKMVEQVIELRNKDREPI